MSYDSDSRVSPAERVGDALVRKLLKTKGKKIAKHSKSLSEEWERILAREGLPMGRGNRNWLTYYGTTAEVGGLYDVMQADTGKVKAR